MKKLLLAATALAILPCAALAADMRLKGPVAHQAPYSWAGSYIYGVVGGGIFGSQLGDDYEGVSYGYMHNSEWAFTGGGGLGYNWQWGNFVAGIEGDINWTSFDKTISTPGWPTTFNAKWDWYSTIRVRAGLAVDRAYVYATGGIAIVDVNYTAFDTGTGFCDVANDYCARLKKTEVGVVAGVGAEYAFGNNWTAKLEYLGIWLPTSDRVVDPYDTDYTYAFTSYAHVLRYGLTYRFGGR